MSTDQTAGTSAEANSTLNRSGRGLFQCGTCSQSYSRVDHLARHVRSHTQEKPYRCETCGKQFNRGDLLRRHSLLHTTASGDVQNKRRRTGTNPLSLRASKACEGCAEHHLKCEDEKPCRRCVRRNIACVVAPKFFLEGIGQSGPRSGDLSPQDEPAINAQNPPMQPSATNQETLNLGLAAYDDSNAFHQDLSQSQIQTQPGSSDMPDVMDFLPSGLFATNLPSGTLTPNGMIGYGVEADLNFSAIDLSFLGSYNTHVPFQIENPLSQATTQNFNTVGQTSGGDDHVTDPESLNGPLHQSIWRFVPAPGVHAYIDQANLSIPDQEQIVDIPDSFADVNRRATTEKLDAVTRDKIFAIVLSQVKSHILPALSTFPSINLLDNLIQYFLAGPIPMGSSWIHIASFRPKKARAELLLAMVATGAVLTPDRSLRKLGFAIQEVIRLHIPTLFESDNTLIRDLELLQAFMLQLEIGLWSGNNRRIEISESFLQPLLSMIRRGGRFRRLAYPMMTIAADEEGPSLEKKWRTWVEQESFKRLAYHLLGHDSRASISLLVSPLISYSELNLPLPEAQELWSAASAHEWKRLYRAKFESNRIRIPSLTECIANLDLLELNKTVIDLKLSCSVFLYAMWGIVWEYRKLALLFCGKTNLWDSSLAMMTRYQELMKIFEYYRVTYSGESTLLLELILMHLHMSLEEIQLFAGLEGPEEARRVQASVKDWANSKTSRQAVWYGGQVFRAVKRLPPLHLRDFNAISLFHATLTFWAYGLASHMLVPTTIDGHVPQAALATSHSQEMLWLDEEETAATYRYISLNWGMPALQGARPDLEAVLLSDPKSVMNVVIQIMRQGDGESQLDSPLVENLIHVIERLRDTKTRESVLEI